MKRQSSYAAFLEKQAILSDALTQVTPREMYDDIFPDGDLERRGQRDDRKANMIIAYRVDSKGGGLQNEIVFAGKDGLRFAEKNPFALCGLCTYSGRRRTARNAYRCYGFAFDLDGVGVEECKTVLLGISLKKLPCPQYIVNSGHGLHLYFIFERPVPLYRSVRDYLQRIKIALTRIIWTNETSTIKSRPDNDRRDYLGIYQNMRLPGSCSKLGRGKSRMKYLVTAYRYNTYAGARCSLSYLNSWVAESDRVPENEDYSSWDYDVEKHLTLDEAREQFPEWYQKRIVEGRPPKQWVCKRDLYDWWLQRIQQPDGAHDGTRYNCISVLFIYAIKCGITFDEVYADAMSLVAPFQERTIKPDNDFTVNDVQEASKFYKRSYARYSIRAIEMKTHLNLPRNKRNGRKQEIHLQFARGIRELKSSMGENVSGGGRPKGSSQQKKMVEEWRATHPDGTPKTCIAETGISKNTVYRWWNDGEPA